MITEKAYGKINLSLNILGKLPNGYHQVEMVMQQIDLHDEVILSLRDDDKIIISSNMKNVPLDNSNLAYRAALIMKEEFSLTAGINIHLEKRLPLEAGLAGGSSNGAAVLKGMNKLFALNAPREGLMALAARLGADMPFCVLGGTALATGIGDVLKPLPSHLTLSLILIKPPFGASTQEVYGNLVLDQLKNRPDANKMIKALAAGEETGVIAALGNVLEEVTISMYPEIQQIKDELRSFEIPSLMSGSGTTVFGIIPAKGIALREKAGDYFKKKKGYQVFFTSTL